MGGRITGSNRTTTDIGFSQPAVEQMLYFFFQAEDGIRDADVTGVQTCALPISTTRRDADNEASSGSTTSQTDAKDWMPPVVIATIITRPASASEESTWALS